MSANLAIALLLLVTCLASITQGQRQRNVSILNGTLTGQRTTVGNTTTDVWEFLGIPFAEPPIGNLRFALPVPLRYRWVSPLDANKFGPRCPQPGGSSDENCLFLNIWTPIDTTTRKPVMVWIHGGAYVGGSAHGYMGSALAGLGDVVVVVLQYRLGILGFLRLDNTALTGNWGLWDQRLALRWVQENIAAFGGDPNSVTIFGESAGSGSISLHLMSAGSSSLFHRAILESGVVGNPWAFNPNTEAIAGQYQLFTDKYLGCKENRPDLVIACLRTKSMSDILKAQQRFSGPISSFVVAPLMDGVFFKEDPEQTLLNGRFPVKEIVLGANDDEGSNMAYSMITAWARAMGIKDPKSLGYLKAALIPQIIKNLLKYYPQFPTPAKPEVSDVMVMRAVSQKDPNNPIFNARNLADMVGEFGFYCGINTFADHYRRVSNQSLYMYEFAHRSSLSKAPSWMGAGHATEIPFVFGDPILYPSKGYNPEEVNISTDMLMDWTTFAKTGKPYSVQWIQYSKTKKEFFRYSVPNSDLDEYGVRRDQCYFWDDLLPFVSGLGVINSTSTVRPNPTPEPESCPTLSDTGKALVAIFAILSVLLAIVIFMLYYKMKNNRMTENLYKMT